MVLPKFLQDNKAPQKKGEENKKQEFRDKCLILLSKIKEKNEQRYHELQKVFHKKFDKINIQKKFILGFYAQLKKEFSDLIASSPEKAPNKKAKSASKKKVTKKKAASKKTTKKKVAKKTTKKKVAKKTTKKKVAKKTTKKKVAKKTTAKKATAKKTAAKKKTTSKKKTSTRKKAKR